MIYIVSGIFGILIVFFMIKGCSYPTSYRAFIPKALDSEYKEYQRLCKEEIGKVVYARPMGDGARVEDIHLAFPYFLVSDSIVLHIVSVASRESEGIVYIYIENFEYYTSWTEKSFSIHGDYKQRIRCRPLEDFKGGYAIIKKKALENKEYIGDEMIIKELRRIGRMSYRDLQTKYISQVFKEAINAKSPHYIDLKEFQ
ncbi:hypothetical protein [Helicobacter typhlonius]|uniref:hypothetical protein n=1 Tax=Helicobacter typhlonius TaxID=76936 RepID=UPI002FE30416